MNNRGQNVNPNGTPQNYYPNQGYPQQNSQYQGNGYNGQNPQNFNRNVNNQNPYQSRNSQANNVNNQQFQGYSNGQNQPQNNMNNPQYRGQRYNGQSPQNNNMNTPQYRGQGYNNQNQQYNNINNQQYRAQGNNGQNPQFGNPSNPQFSNQNGYNNPNQFNPQFGNNNNPNFNSMNQGPKLDSKMVGYITAAVAAIVVVLMIFMFSGGSGKLGGATPDEALRNVLDGAKASDYKKIVNNTYFESNEKRSRALDKINNNEGNAKNNIDFAKKFMDLVEVGEVKYLSDDRAKVEIRTSGSEILKSFGGNASDYKYVRKQNGRWFIEDNSF